jgi:hypothetical protein
MSNLKKKHPEIASHQGTTWDSVILLSLIEMANKVIDESQRNIGGSLN